jgi:hypothetical protein
VCEDENVKGKGQYKGFEKRKRKRSVCETVKNETREKRLRVKPRVSG